MSLVKWLFILAAAGYLALGALMFFAQRALMYFPERVRTLPAAAGLPQADEITLDTADGEKIIASVTVGDVSKFSFDVYYKLEKENIDKRILVVLAKTGMVCYDYGAKKVAVVPKEVKDKLQ